MREILFRGKRVDNGEWVKGDPAGSIRGAVSKIDYFDGLTDCETVDVIPSTVGQFTGLADKNGNKIFEGDIIQYETQGIIERYIVSWNDESALFAVKGLSGLVIGDFTFFAPQRCEIINNIHDNPELLEEKK